ncbi:MAG: hypothetical protein F4Z41_10255 [Acidimicrobiia bacterium]|nr:hypothetical protein [Acidimicrobiia bacterium]MYB79487.1 hypothetical protein [Acidimicrobiia bacterium]
MEVTISLFGFLALTQLFTIGLLWRTNLLINARLDTVAGELRTEIRALAAEMRSEFQRINQRLTQVEQKVASMDQRLTQVEQKVASMDQRLSRLEEQSDIKV